MLETYLSDLRDSGQINHRLDTYRMFIVKQVKYKIWNVLRARTNMINVRRVIQSIVEVQRKEGKDFAEGIREGLSYK